MPGRGIARRSGTGRWNRTRVGASWGWASPVWAIGAFFGGCDATTPSHVGGHRCSAMATVVPLTTDTESAPAETTRGDGECCGMSPLSCSYLGDIFFGQMTDELLAFTSPCGHFFSSRLPDPAGPLPPLKFAAHLSYSLLWPFVVMI